MDYLGAKTTFDFRTDDDQTEEFVRDRCVTIEYVKTIRL